LDVSGWDFPSVTDMSNMFYYAFRQVDNVNIIGISDWDTSGVTNMYGMFYSAFNMCGTVNIDLSSWDVSNVENFGYMFVYSANQVQDLSYGDFSSWNIKSGANVSGMYSGIYLTNYAPIDIGSINIPASANINSIFEYSNINASVNLKGNPSDYRYAFSSTSTHEGGEVIVNYTSSVIDIDAIIATKSNESNVTKGELITT
jgi:surface protein